MLNFFLIQSCDLHTMHWLKSKVWTVTSVIHVGIESELKENQAQMCQIDFQIKKCTLSHIAAAVSSTRRGRVIALDGKWIITQQENMYANFGSALMLHLSRWTQPSFCFPYTSLFEVSTISYSNKMLQGTIYSFLP